MKFLMVMIICFAEDACQAVFDSAEFQSYDYCMTQAMPVSRYMQEVYPNTSGEIHCLSEEDYATYKAFIDNGGKPSLSLQHPENTKNSI
tara:strand:- start:967 stop:1233 length:267 start_codon:yes stop_codon:yes gene_type:complete